MRLFRPGIEPKLSRLGLPPTLDEPDRSPVSYPPERSRPRGDGWGEATVQLGPRGAGGDGAAARHGHHRDANGDDERFPSDVHAPRRLLSGKAPRPSPLL